MKTNKLKKILSIVILSVVLAITATVIILAVVPKRHYNPVERDNVMVISVWRETVDNSYVRGEIGSEEQNKIANEILDLHEKSLKDNVLSSIFQGTSGFEPEVTKYGYSDVSKELKKDATISVVLDFAEEQTLKFNGEEYKDTTAQTTKSVKYSRAVLTVTNSSSFEKATLYLTDDNFTSSYQIKFLAHQSELYDYIVNLNIPVNKN